MVLRCIVRQQVREFLFTRGFQGISRHTYSRVYTHCTAERGFWEESCEQRTYGSMYNRLNASWTRGKKLHEADSKSVYPNEVKGGGEFETDSLLGLCISRKCDLGRNRALSKRFLHESPQSRLRKLQGVCNTISFLKVVPLFLPSLTVLQTVTRSVKCFSMTSKSFTRCSPPVLSILATESQINFSQRVGKEDSSYLTDLGQHKAIFLI